VKLGIENRKQMIAAAVLGVFLLLVVVYEFMPSSSTIASTAPATTIGPETTGPKTSRSAPRRTSGSVTVGLMTGA